MPRFSLTPVDEVRLHHAPLAKVIMQIQYSRTPQLVTDEAESSIAEALARYPVRRRQLVTNLFPSMVVNGQPVQLPGNTSAGTLLQFTNPSASWQLVVSETSLSVETTEYSTRDDFCDRAAELLRAVAAVALPPVVDRVGLRYIDRLCGDELAKVPDYMVAEVRALSGAVEPPLIVHHSVTESVIVLGPDEQLQVRSGLLPPGGAFDPAVPPLQENSWVLDMDVATTQAGFAFDTEELIARLRRYAEAAYAFFRFATTDAFQDEHRGEPASLIQNAR